MKVSKHSEVVVAVAPGSNLAGGSDLPAGASILHWSKAGKVPASVLVVDQHSPSGEVNRPELVDALGERMGAVLAAGGTVITLGWPIDRVPEDVLELRRSLDLTSSSKPIEYSLKMRAEPVLPIHLRVRTDTLMTVLPRDMTVRGEPWPLIFSRGLEASFQFEVWKREGKEKVRLLEFPDQACAVLIEGTASKQVLGLSIPHGSGRLIVLPRPLLRMDEVAQILADHALRKMVSAPGLIQLPALDLTSGVKLFGVPVKLGSTGEQLLRYLGARPGRSVEPAKMKKFMRGQTAGALKTLASRVRKALLGAAGKVPPRYRKDAKRIAAAVVHQDKMVILKIPKAEVVLPPRMADDDV